MARKSDNERLQELENQMEKIKARKQQLENRLKEKERKERTKRLIEVGAIFEKHFQIESKEEAEKLALSLKKYVLENKEKVMKQNLKQLREHDQKQTNREKEQVVQNT
ncbi:hypothetical protein ACK1LH_21055 (plasmid) [Metabacillus indicus]|uniref:hypothetical protein n=1 Tax=Metabacillus indicus TaxID=246786 RepID=UPI0039843C2E